MRNRTEERERERKFGQCKLQDAPNKHEKNKQQTTPNFHGQRPWGKETLPTDTARSNQSINPEAKFYRPKWHWTSTGTTHRYTAHHEHTCSHGCLCVDFQLDLTRGSRLLSPTFILRRRRRPSSMHSPTPAAWGQCGASNGPESPFEMSSPSCRCYHAPALTVHYHLLPGAIDSLPRFRGSTQRDDGSRQNCTNCLTMTSRLPRIDVRASSFVWVFSVCCFRFFFRCGAIIVCKKIREGVHPAGQLEPRTLDARWRFCLPSALRVCVCWLVASKEDSDNKWASVPLCGDDLVWLGQEGAGSKNKNIFTK